MSWLIQQKNISNKLLDKYKKKLKVLTWKPNLKSNIIEDYILYNFLIIIIYVMISY